MTQAQMLEHVKNALGISGTYQDNTITEYIDEVLDFLKCAGVNTETVTPGLVSQGVNDLWNYGNGNREYSPAFLMRATQLSYKGGA